MHNRLLMTADEQAAFDTARTWLEPRVRQRVASARDADLLLLRLERYWNDAYQPLQRLYAQHPRWNTCVEQMLGLLLDAYVVRPDRLKLLDLERELTPDWFQRSNMVGGIYYVDLFGGTLAGLEQHLDYIRDLGLTYVHLMPLLEPRPGLNDGGYAVQNYRAVNPALGSLADLRHLAATMHDHAISLCIDVVLNHTAKEHEWAQRAMSGDPEFLDFYLTFPDRTLPDQYERTLPEVFPDFAPGNFTWYDDMAGTGRWVWTTFNDYQWDLNYTNPAVFSAMLDVLLFLANQGIDVLRLDAVPFMWKRMGTNCQNQPEVLDILQAFRALMKMVCPATICKAEAIVSPDDLVQYLGQGQRTGKLCEIAYHNSLMVLAWSSLAAHNVRLMTHSLQQMPPTPAHSAWVTYVRCHDDIGWAITDENAAAVGANGFAHRQFLVDFYSGVFPGTWARGDVFQYNPVTKDGRISGMTASLAGLETALAAQDTYAIDLAIKRILLLYSLIFAYGGIPLIYMGDEIGLLNDHGFLAHPDKAADNRWLHRPPMDWDLADQRHDSGSIAGRIFSAMQHMIEVRKATPMFHSAGAAYAIWTGNEHVVGIVRAHTTGRVLIVANFHDTPQHISVHSLWEAGLRGEIRDLLQADGTALPLSYDRLALQPYGYCWLVGSQSQGA